MVSEKFMPEVGPTFIRPDVLGSDHCPIGVLLKKHDGKFYLYSCATGQTDSSLCPTTRLRTHLRCVCVIYIILVFVSPHPILSNVLIYDWH